MQYELSFQLLRLGFVPLFIVFLRFLKIIFTRNPGPNIFCLTRPDPAVISQNFAKTLLARKTEYYIKKKTEQNIAMQNKNKTNWL